MYFNFDFRSTTSSHKKQNKYIFCSNIYSSTGDLKTHIVIHTEDNKYNCKNCQRTSRFKQELNKHTILHTAKFQFKFEICQQLFKQKRYFETAYDYPY